MNDSRTEIRLDVLRQNLALVRDTLGKRTDFIAMLKADAYGHGLDLVAPVAWEAGVRRFAVFHIEEAVRLRQLLPDCRILLACPAEPADMPLLLGLQVQPFVVSPAHARALAREAVRLNGSLAVHAKIDTGMGRLGFDWETADRELLALAREPGLTWAGAGTHLASAGAEHDTFALEQIRRFRHALAGCAQGGLRFPFLHAANSEGLCRSPDWHFDAVRPGILLYGYGSALPGSPATRPFLQWKTRLVQVKDVPAGFPVSYDSTYTTRRPTRIGTFPVGYADGYFRAWSNKACVLVGGRRAPVAGRVTMNLTMADLGPDSTAAPGDEVVLLGEQQNAFIWADELAALAGTISYEVLTSIRSPRIPLEGHGPA